MQDISIQDTHKENQIISIIIPVYNGEKTLEQCLSSILCQSYKNFELILIDNNSSDNTKQIIQKLIKNDKRIKYFFEKEQTRGAARNTGEKQAKGEIILMTDSDCVLPDDWIKKIIAPILNKECDAVQGSEEPLVNDFWSQQITIREKNKIKNKPLGNIDTKNFAITKKGLEKIGFTNKKYFSGTDTELSIRFEKNNLKLKFINDIKVKHKNENSIRGMAKKYFIRAKWCAIISRDYKNYLNGTKFLSDTDQTLWNFLKFFPGIFITTLKKGFKYAYFDLITGIFWRAGLIYGKIKNN
jgi:glycosyltransferase involved in cell wall biosynthesis